MGVKPLLALHNAPDLNAVFGKPLNNEGGLVVLSPQAVKHEYQQNVKLALKRHPLDLLNGVPVLGRDLKAGNAFLGKLSDDLPVRLMLAIFMAALLLHGYIVFFHLPHRRDTVQAHHTLLYALDRLICQGYDSLLDLFSHTYLAFVRSAAYVWPPWYSLFKVPFYTTIIAHFAKIRKKSVLLCPCVCKQGLLDCPDCRGVFLSAISNSNFVPVYKEHLGRLPICILFGWLHCSIYHKVCTPFIMAGPHPHAGVALV